MALVRVEFYSNYGLNESTDSVSTFFVHFLVFVIGLKFIVLLVSLSVKLLIK